MRAMRPVGPVQSVMKRLIQPPWVGVLRKISLVPTRRAQPASWCWGCQSREAAAPWTTVVAVTGTRSSGRRSPAFTRSAVNAEYVPISGLPVVAEEFVALDAHQLAALVAVVHLGHPVAAGAQLVGAQLADIPDPRGNGEAVPQVQGFVVLGVDATDNALPQAGEVLEGKVGLHGQPQGRLVGRRLHPVNIPD